MSNLSREMKRNQLKNELKTNKINTAYHNRYDTLDQRIRRELKKNAKNN